MLVQTGLNPMNQTDLELLVCGTEDCSPGHFWGPGVRDYWLVHYVLEGCGVLSTGGGEWPVHAGQMFLIEPDSLVMYRADGQQPWRYIWVGFTGTKAAEWLHGCGFSSGSPVFTDASGYIRDCFVRMTETFALPAGRELRLTGLLYQALSGLYESASDSVPERPQSERSALYVRQAMRFLESNMANGTGVAEAARHIGLERSYFSALFRRHVGFSPRDWLMNLKADHAMRLLSNPSLSIADVARSVGYEDPLLFSRIFRKRTGQSPASFRRSLR